MGDITDQHDQTSPPDVAESHSVGNGNSAPANEARGVKRQRPSAEDDDDDDEKGGRERRKIEIKFISDKSRRHITFSKRKAGIMKKVSCAPGEGFPSIRRRHRRDAFLHHYRGLWPSSVASTNQRFASQAYELSVLTGTQVLLLVVSETGLVYTFTTPKLQPLVTKTEGKNLIQVRNLPAPLSCGDPASGFSRTDAHARRRGLLPHLFRARH